MFLLVWVTLLFAVGSNYANKDASQEQTTCSQNGPCIMLSDAELTAEAGLCVVIPCHFTTDPDIPLELRVWHKCDPSKQNCSDSDIVLHLNDSSPNAHTGSRVRASLLEPDLSQKNCSIIINDLSESLSGSYHFRLNGILNGTERKYASSGANVTVKGLTQKPTVMIPPLTEGQQTTLTCTAPGLCSGSDHKITWMWGGAGETDSHITGNITAFKTENLTAVTQRHSSNLTFNPSAKHHGTNVTCKVSFANSISTEETVTLNISLKGNTATEKMTTPDVTNVKKSEITGNTSVNEGDVLSLTCSFESFPPSLVIWSKVPSKKNLNSVPDTNLQNSTGSATLVIPNVTAEHTGQYICTATHLNKTLTMYANVTVILSPKILKSSGCIHQSEVLTCVCISEGFPLPTIKWPLLENHTEYSVLIAVSNHTVNSTATLTVKDHSTSVECVSSNTNGEAKENLIISNAEQKQKEEGEVIKVLRIITRWEIIIAFLVGTFLSAIICCLARKCHRKKQRIYGNLAETLEMVSSHEDPPVDAGQAVEDYQSIDQVADEARGAVVVGKSEVEYSKIDFSLIKRKDPEEAGETQGTTETEYAEIKELKKIKEESEEDQDEEGEEEMTGEDEEKKHCEPEEKEGEGEGEGEDVALYSSVRKTNK
ncbi:sialic acid-binding Ig-like lectin 5 [Epinephelus moara]|uniref:sialic acid-binding Ig-like lectin 5 n=1 Tax=Epinephelus moara TaxID=300413 RepID=UPI00214EC7F9|nr:sialic acid-binding Ig-like lectin 5 [Epinephelus moara]